MILKTKLNSSVYPRCFIRRVVIMIKFTYIITDFINITNTSNKMSLKKAFTLTYLSEAIGITERAAAVQNNFIITRCLHRKYHQHTCVNKN